MKKLSGDKKNAQIIIFDRKAKNMLHQIRIICVCISVYAFALHANVINNIGLSFGGGQSFEIDYDDNTYHKLSISVALSIEMFDSKYFSLKSTVGYDQKGSNGLYFNFTDFIFDTINSSDSLVDEKRRSDYLSLRILGKFKFLLQTKMKPYLLVGPSINYLLKRRVEDTWLGAEKYDITDKTTRWSYGISSGLGTEFLFKKLRISPYALVNIDLNKTKAEFNYKFRNGTYFFAIELAYVLNH